MISHYLPLMQGGSGVHSFHATDLRAPEGTGNLAIKIPKGTLVCSSVAELAKIAQEFNKIM